MNITIVGLGGVGGIVGSRLAAMKAPDHRVIFWCRGDTHSFEFAVLITLCSLLMDTAAVEIAYFFSTLELVG